LQKYSDDNEGITDFTISGVCNFGILVGFNQNVNLYGANGSVIYQFGGGDKGTSNGLNADPAEFEQAQAITVGSVQNPEEGPGSYTGILNIDKSVNVILHAVVAIGINVYSCGDNSILTINGNFMIECVAAGTGVAVQDINVGGTLIVNGNF
jgi:hypothetical protein